MSNLVVGWAWKQKVGSPLRKLILMKLADCADDDGWSRWRQSKLAAECETSRQTVNEHVAALRGMGVVQVVEQRRQDGGRAASSYRILGPWVEDVADPDRGARQDDKPPVGVADNKNRKEEEPGPPTPQTPLPPRHVGGRRWEVVSSRPGRGPFVADLDAGTCTCENRSKNPCRHLSAAEEAEEGADTGRRKAMRNALWDTLVELLGKPLNARLRGDFGRAVSDIAASLVEEGVEAKPEAWAGEVRARHAALVGEWGQGKVTLRSLTQNWGLAGRLRQAAAGGAAEADERFRRFR